MSFFLLLAAFAQSFVTLSGDLYTSAGRPSGSYHVELVGVSSNTPVERTVSGSDGRFAFRSVAAGTYMIFVKTENGDVIALQSVSSAMGGEQIHIQIAEAGIKNTPVNGTISALTLQHHPPKKAVREMNEAIQAGHSEAAQEHLRAALAIDPLFSGAHTNLGVEYTRAGKLELAYAELEAALKTGPKGAMQYCNLAVVALAMRRTSEAEQEVRQALSIESRYAQANYLLGRILAGQPGHYEEAVKHLKLAAAEVPNASAVLQRMGVSLR